MSANLHLTPQLLRLLADQLEALATATAVRVSTFTVQGHTVFLDVTDDQREGREYRITDIVADVQLGPQR